MPKRSQSAPKRTEQFTIRVSPLGKRIADWLADRHGLRSRAAAIEYALRKVGRDEGIEGDGGIQSQD